MGLVGVECVMASDAGCCRVYNSGCVVVVYMWVSISVVVNRTISLKCDIGRSGGISFDLENFNGCWNTGITSGRYWDIIGLYF